MAEVNALPDANPAVLMREKHFASQLVPAGFSVVNCWALHAFGFVNVRGSKQSGHGSSDPSAVSRARRTTKPRPGSDLPVRPSAPTCEGRQGGVQLQSGAGPARCRDRQCHRAAGFVARPKAPSSNSAGRPSAHTELRAAPAAPHGRRCAAPESAVAGPRRRPRPCASHDLPALMSSRRRAPAHTRMTCPFSDHRMPSTSLRVGWSMSCVSSAAIASSTTATNSCSLMFMPLWVPSMSLPV